VPLVDNARRDGALELRSGGSALGVRGQGGLSRFLCGVEASQPLYYRGVIPAGRRGEFRVTPSAVTDYQKLYLVVTDGDEAACVVSSESDLAAANHTLVYENRSDSDLEVTLAVGAAGIVADDLELSVLFTLTEPPL